MIRNGKNLSPDAAPASGAATVIATAAAATPAPAAESASTTPAATAPAAIPTPVAQAPQIDIAELAKQVTAHLQAAKALEAQIGEANKAKAAATKTANVAAAKAGQGTPKPVAKKPIALSSFLRPVIGRK